MKKFLKIGLVLLVILGGIIAINYLSGGSGNHRHGGGDLGSTTQELSNQIDEEWNASENGWNKELFDTHIKLVNQKREANYIKLKDANQLKWNICNYAVNCISAGLEEEWNKPSCQQKNITSIYKGISVVDKQMDEVIKEVVGDKSKLEKIKEKKQFFDKVWNFAGILKTDNLGRTPDAKFDGTRCTWTDFAQIERDIKSTLNSYKSNAYYTDQFKDITYISSAFNGMTDAKYSKAKGVYYDTLEKQIEPIYREQISNISEDSDRESICSAIQSDLKRQAGSSSDAFTKFTRLILEEL